MSPAPPLLLPRPTTATCTPTVTSNTSSSVSVASVSSASSSVSSETDNQSPVLANDNVAASSPSAPQKGTDVNEDLALKERNRIHAKKSRQRRKSLTEDLHNKLEQLKEENEVLRNFIMSRIMAKNAKTSTPSRKELDDMVSQKRAEPTLRFLEQFKSDPKNRRVNSKQIRFLQGLRRHLPQPLPSGTNTESTAVDDATVKQAPAPAQAISVPDTNKSSCDFDDHFMVVA